MRRREFIGLAGGAVAWPLAATAQQADRVYRIGYLGVGSAANQASRMGAFRAGLAALGYAEGKNIIIEERRAEGSYEQLAALMAQLIELKVDIIVTHSTPGVLAAKRATTTIPIVTASAGDLVGSGLVASVARPGGNVTGLTFFSPELAGKRLELLREAMPSLVQVGVLINSTNPEMNAPVLTALKQTAQALKLELFEFAVREVTDLEPVFAEMAAKPVRAFVISDDPLLIYNVEISAKLALKHRLASCGFVEMARAGGFVGYGIDFPDMWRRAASFVDKIFKGATPADLPVDQATKFVTSVNLKTAKEIGIDVPTSLLLRADEIIE
jgi:putative tryptophan/tyrosine transport system substrate-binding protein